MTSPKKLVGRVRKPKEWGDGAYISDEGKCICIYGGITMRLKSAKGFHTWLGRAIRYLESRSKKR